MATETKFTPGEWDTEDDGQVCATDHPSRAIICSRFNEGALAENWPANSALIAAAPDLYAALEAIIAWEHSEDGPLAWEVLGQAKAALAKARGEVS